MSYFPPPDCAIDSIEQAVFAFLNSLTTLFLSPLKIRVSVHNFVESGFLTRDPPFSLVDEYRC